MARVFTPERRARTRTALIEHAQQDPRISGAAVTGSSARGEEDRWSDIDLFFAVASDAPVEGVLEDWREHLYREFGALHHFDLRGSGAVYRVFLLQDQLEVDLGFTPADAFGPLGPGPFKVLFGDPVQRRLPQPPTEAHLAGLAMHHVLHARVCIERGKLWQAEYWISTLRDQAVELAAARRGLETAYAKGAHLLPTEFTDELQQSLFGELSPPNLRRALECVARCLHREMHEQNEHLAGVMESSFRELAGANAVSVANPSASPQPPG